VLKLQVSAIFIVVIAEQCLEYTWFRLSFGLGIILRRTWIYQDCKRL